MSAKKEKKKKRRDSLLSQQKLPTWQPVINVGTTWFIFIGAGILFTALGVGQVILLAQMTDDIEVKYSDSQAHPEIKECKMEETKENSSKSCPTCFKGSKDCPVNFEVMEKMKVPVFVYYQMTDFFQNHRLYVSSRDDNQLVGDIDEKINKEKCAPPFLENKEQGKYYYPCGAAANAMFTDKFLKLEHVKDGDNSEIELKDDASLITWDIEKKYKYKNPKGVNLGRTSNQNKAEVKRFKRKFVQPKKWTDAVYQDFWDKGGVENPHFINWMHQAPMQNFRKLYAVITKGCKEEPEFLCTGKYIITVDYRYQPEDWTGEKTLIFSTTSIFGTRKPFMAYFTLALGVFSIAVGILFVILKKTLKSKVHPHTRHSMVQEEDLATEADPNKPTDDEMSIKIDQRKSRDKSNKEPSDDSDDLSKATHSKFKSKKRKISNKVHHHHKEKDKDHTNHPDPEAAIEDTESKHKPKHHNNHNNHKAKTSAETSKNKSKTKTK